MHLDLIALFDVRCSEKNTETRKKTQCFEKEREKPLSMGITFMFAYNIPTEIRTMAVYHRMTDINVTITHLQVLQVVL